MVDAGSIAGRRVLASDRVGGAVLVARRPVVARGLLIGLAVLKLLVARGTLRAVALLIGLAVLVLRHGLVVLYALELARLLSHHGDELADRLQCVSVIRNGQLGIGAIVADDLLIDKARLSSSLSSLLGELRIARRVGNGGDGGGAMVVSDGQGVELAVDADDLLLANELNLTLKRTLLGVRSVPRDGLTRSGRVVVLDRRCRVHAIDGAVGTLASEARLSSRTVAAVHDDCFDSTEMELSVLVLSEDAASIVVVVRWNTRKLFRRGDR